MGRSEVSPDSDFLVASIAFLLEFGGRELKTSRLFDLESIGVVEADAIVGVSSLLGNIIPGFGVDTPVVRSTVEGEPDWLVEACKGESGVRIVGGPPYG